MDPLSLSFILIETLLKMILNKYSALPISAKLSNDIPHCGSIVWLILLINNKDKIKDGKRSFFSQMIDRLMDLVQLKLRTVHTRTAL